MKKLIILLIVVGCSSVLSAQQLPQFTQYMINNYAINPAVAGMQDYYQVNTTVRSMWVGIEGAPKTTLLSIYGKKGDNTGVGGMVYSDQAGSTSRLGGTISYAHHFSLSDDIRVLLSEKYMELYKKLTGKDFVPYKGDVKSRIMKNLSEASIL